MTLDRARKRQVDFQVPWKQVVKTALFLLFLAIVLFCVEKIRDMNEFPIRRVKIYGVNHLDVRETQHMLLPFVSKGFFAVDVFDVREQLLQIPWISDVSVRRVWPDGVLITVTEKHPVARWNDDRLLGSAGEVFNPASGSFSADLPHLIGPEGQQMAVLQFYSKMSTLFSPLHLKIRRIELSPYLSWEIELTNGMKMRLGYKDVLTRVSHFVKVYPKIVGERAGDVDYVDLRYPNGLAVRWKTVS
ncbi:MAG TPA: cell division protein FtsQ/DivIB [Gammaproteobacteria bacterium]|nr:cell division protein FtsQ/DivIB [Gammaproteobacteria bacterium]